jgi:hypothetical protein
MPLQVKSTIDSTDVSCSCLQCGGDWYAEELLMPHVAGCEEAVPCSEVVVPCCLFCRWMQLQSYTRQCPVCKAGVEEDTIIPIYGRGAENPAPAGDNEKAQPLPARPAGQRPAPVLLQVRGEKQNLGVF